MKSFKLFSINSLMDFLKRHSNFISLLKSPNLFIVLAILTMLPLFVISFFNNPGSDDFDFAYDAQTTPFLELQIRNYFNWSGRFFCNGLISTNPLVFNNYFLFKIIPILLLLFFIFSINFFLTKLNLFNSKNNKWAFVGLIVFLYIYQMPDVCEGFYWLPGALTNLLPVPLALLFYCFLLPYFKTKKWFLIIITPITLLAAIGCNEIIVVELLLINFSLLIFHFTINKKLNYSLLMVCILTLLFASIELLAPGNAVRASNITIKHQFIYSVLKSIQITFSLITKWIPIIILCCFFILEELVALVESPKIDKKYLVHPFIAFCFSFIVVYIGIFPGLWSLNSCPPNRTINTIYFVFLFAFFYFIITMINYCKTKNYDLKYSNTIKFIIAIIILFNFISENTIVVAYHDLLSGKAYKYNIEMKERFELLKKYKSSQCVLPQLNNTPSTIYSKTDMGLTNDKNNWKNLEISKYFRKKEIVIQPTDSLLTE